MRSSSIGAVMAFTAVAGVLVACGGESKPAAAPSSTTGAPAGDAAGSSPAAVSGDWSLNDKETWTNYQKDAKEWAEKTSAKCGTLSGSWNAESFRPHMAEMTKDPHARGRCQAAFDAVSDICKQGDMEKQAVAKKIKSVECTWADKGKGGANITGGKLVIPIETNADSWTPSYADIIKKQL